MKTKNHLILFGFLFLVGSSLYAQIPPTIEWSETFGGTSLDTPNAIRHTADGGYIIAGKTHSNDGDIGPPPSLAGSAWVVKLDGEGNLEWEQTYDGGGSVMVSSTSSKPPMGAILGWALH